MRRMYGDFTLNPEFEGPGPGGGPGMKRKRSTPGVPDLHAAPGPSPTSDGNNSFFGKLSRSSRQSFKNNQSSESGRFVFFYSVLC